ncbi:MAG: SIMPL domain-containing protein, partial [Bacteroidota bacterium]|nr:SIMPL domain-containing protein [Bacteroidota bacterium]
MECKCDKKLWAALILGASLIAFGFIMKSAVNNYINKDRKVTVKGLSEREEPANLITWSFSTSVTGDDLPSLNRRMDRTRDNVIAFLAQNGLPAEAIRFYPPDVDDRLNNRWSNDALPYNYKITTSFNVTSSEIDKVRELITK